MLKRILIADGVSGREEEAAEVIRQEFIPFCDEVKIHRTHSVIGYKKATRLKAGETPKSLMFAAHLDQIGLVITRIEKGGFLRFSGIGYDYKVLTGQPVLVMGREKVRGVISAGSIVTVPSSNWEKNPAMMDLFIDTGLSEDEVHQKLRVGDLVKLDVEPLELQNDFYSSPVLDDRSCVAGMILGMERLVDLHHDRDLYFVATCGEESTGKGARSAAWEINPDTAIAMDVTFGTQPGAAEPLTYPVGKGLTLSLGPVFDTRSREQMVKICQMEKIPFVDEPDMVGFGTDAASIRRTRGGIPVNLISLPIKSMHTPVEMMSLNDLKELGRFVSAVAANIDKSLENQSDSTDTDESDSLKKGADDDR